MIETYNNSPENMFIQSATLNGKTLNQPWIYAYEVQAGGKLILNMGAEPNEKWGSGKENRPPDANF